MVQRRMSTVCRPLSLLILMSLSACASTPSGVPGAASPTASPIASPSEAASAVPLVLDEYTPATYITTVGQPFNARLECKAFTNYGESDTAADIVYGHEYGSWSFSSTGGERTILIRGSWPDVTQLSESPDLSFAVNQQVYFSGDPGFTVGRPFAIDEQGRTHSQAFNNWATYSLRVPTQPGVNTLVIRNNLNKRDLWVAIDWLQIN